MEYQRQGWGRPYSREAWVNASPRMGDGQQERRPPSFQILEHVATISRNSFNGDTVELNVMSWNGGREKMDLRRWKNGTPSGGVCLSPEEAAYLLEVLTAFMRPGVPAAPAESAGRTLQAAPGDGQDGGERL